MRNKRYGSINGLRMIAAYGIIMMHMRANNNYEISGILYNMIIPAFTNFVFLFMAISSFGLCCGYYDKIMNNQISYNEFYYKRVYKILPFFAVLVLLDIVISPTVEALYEGFANITLLFGFLPNSGDFSVIGVGWFLGLIFVFYICFPFFCTIIANRRKAWIVFGISIIYNLLCTNYFEVGRSNILYSSCFFLAGGLIYLYKDVIEKWNAWIILCVLAVALYIYFAVADNAISCLMVSSVLLVYAISQQHIFLDNKITKFFSGISMEIYLSHMVVFRIVEKVGINRMFGNGWLQYIITVVSVLLGASVFSIVLQRIIRFVLDKVKIKDTVKSI